MRRLGLRLATAVEAMYPIVGSEPGSSTNDATESKIEASRAVIAGVTASVARILAPAPIRAYHERLLSGLNELGSELEDLIHFLHSGDTTLFGQYAALPSLRTINAARIEIERKGYSIG
jgi:hypothetical protein